MSGAAAPRDLIMLVADRDQEAAIRASCSGRKRWVFAR
jgi:hypothetical protein